MTMRLIACGLAVSAGMSLVACGAGADGSLTDRNPTPPDASVIPAVEHPRDVAMMARRACDLLTSDQARELGFDQEPKQRNAIFGTTDCTWSGFGGGGQSVRRLTVSMFTDNATLETAYKQRDRFPLFELTSVEGYPAVIASSNPDLPVCTAHVKTAERQSLYLTVDSDELSAEPRRTCELAKRVASAVLANIPPKR